MELPGGCARVLWCMKLCLSWFDRQQDSWHTTTRPEPVLAVQRRHDRAWTATGNSNGTRFPVCVAVNFPRETRYTQCFIHKVSGDPAAEAGFLASPPTRSY